MIVIGLSLIVGVAKGTKAVFQALIIPDYVPLERLPAASGIQMVCNGILSISVGPLIGKSNEKFRRIILSEYMSYNYQRWNLPIPLSLNRRSIVR